MISTERGETFLEITTLLSSTSLGISILQNRRIYVDSFEKKKFLLVKLSIFMIKLFFIYNSFYRKKVCLLNLRFN